MGSCTICSGVKMCWDGGRERQCPALVNHSMSVARGGGTMFRTVLKGIERETTWRVTPFSDKPNLFRQSIGKSHRRDGLSGTPTHAADGHSRSWHWAARKKGLLLHGGSEIGTPNGALVNGKKD